MSTCTPARVATPTSTFATTSRRPPSSRARRRGRAPTSAGSTGRRPSALPNQASRECFVRCSPGIPTLRPATVADAAGCAHVYVRSKAFAIPEVPEPHTEPEIAAWMAERGDPDHGRVGRRCRRCRRRADDVGAGMAAPSLHRSGMDATRPWRPVHDAARRTTTRAHGAVGVPEQPPRLDGSTSATASSRSSSPTVRRTRSRGPTFATCASV